MREKHRVTRVAVLPIMQILCIASLVLASGCDVITSPAKPAFSNFKCEADFGVVNDQPDAGITTSFTVTNVGESGKIDIMPKLSTSEGEWSRDQTLYFEAGESKQLSYFFHEPTINATNINCSVATIPPS